MNKSQGKIRILSLISKRAWIEKINLIVALNKLKSNLSALEKEINTNNIKRQGLLQAVTNMMGNNQLLDSLLWQEYMQYIQELNNLNKKLNERMAETNLEIKEVEQRVEALSAKENSLKNKIDSINYAFSLDKVKKESVILADFYAAHVGKG